MRRGIKVFAVVLSLTILVISYVLYPPEPRTVSFPSGKKFAFTIVDDTDLATLERVKPLYDVLYQYGLRTTKTVWVLKSNDLAHPPNQGDTLQDAAYREYMLELQRRGFEIALHGVRGGSSARQDIIEGLELFKQILGHYPILHVNHSLNRDNVYWGEHRWSFPLFQWSYALTTTHQFLGHDQTSQYFWGDLVKERIRYVNQFTYSDINLLAVNPSMPYRLSDKPYVNFWFPTANGDTINGFESLLRKENLDKLEREGGVCLVYAHLGAGSFNTKDGRAHPKFEARLKDLASREGWFVPASEILDYLREQPGWRGDLTLREEIRLEILFIWQRLLLAMLPSSVLHDHE